MVDRFVTVDDNFVMPSVVQQKLDVRTTEVATGLIPAISPLQALIVGDGSATLPIRPTTSNPVIFNTTGTPPLNGTVAGGTTGRVAGLDMWISGVGGGGTPSLVVTENPVGSGTYPNRPASTAQVTFQGVVAPGGGGTVSGGTPLMVNTLDVWNQWVLG